MKYLIWLILILLITIRYFTTRPVYHNGDKIRVAGTVYSDPVNYEILQYIKVAGLKIYLPKYPEISYGDKVVLEGVASDGKLKDPKLQKIEKVSGIFLKLRFRMLTFYQSVLPEPHAGLLAGITLGSKGSLSGSFWERVKKSGVAHVVVASGTNVTFVTSFLINFLSIFLPRKKMIPFAILGILLYLTISGFDAPLVRAALMSGSLFLAQETGRLVSSWRLLFLTGLGMLVIRPDWIADVGFILSFVSTASLMLFQPKMDRFFKFVPKFLREGLSTSFAAQIGVAPILFVTFGQFNIWSPIANALVLWTIPMIMILGALGGVAGLAFPALGTILLYLSYPMLWWFVQIVNIFG